MIVDVEGKRRVQGAKQERQAAMVEVACQGTHA